MLRIRAIAPSPDGPLRGLEARMRKSIRLANEETRKDLKSDFEKTVKTWKKKPKFTVRIREDGRSFIITGSTSNKIYNWLDRGTGIYGPSRRPIIIRPVKAKALAFRPNYKAKTGPARLIARSGGASGKTVFAQKVVIKGIRPRHFYRTIARRIEKKQIKRYTKALRDGTRKG